MTTNRSQKNRQRVGKLPAPDRPRFDRRHVVTALVTLLTSLLVLTAVVVVGWLFVTTPLWVVAAFVALAGLPFVLTYVAVQFAGFLVAVGER
ncbi:hypothetical protein HSB1_36820 [Halogranum salarium B-1]|uniref:Uncharacterized protein n=1 Tax=Halogranum salarium B-1 TaxID=1210908 RepID=J2ZC65_9EURY|nr:hypothetical protein HSB1_36820 [Halogranum salarium B-1]